MKIVVTGKIPRAGLEVLKNAGFKPDAWSQDSAMSRGELLAKVAGADILVTLLTEKVDAELLEAAGSNLKAVCNVAVGYNNIDVAACKARNVLVTNTPGVLTDATADIAIALILMTTRRLAEGERVIRSQTPWQWGMHYMLGAGVMNRVLGVVGMGAIGIATARRAKVCGMSVIYHSRSEIDPKIASELSATRVSFDDLLSQSDVVSIHCPSNDSTHHLFGKAQFEKMKPTAFLVNTARGPIVDEQALVDALESKQIAGAGLDVFEFEPKINAGLLHRDNVVMLPHLGSATVETRDAMAMLAANNAVAIANNRAPLTPVG
ncbi:MAG: 2-hydroxyacid dehydrogenase [Actinomycetota bacterium]